MAQPFMNAIITNGGARLLTGAQAGEGNIEFTRIAIGNGEYSRDEKEIGILQNLGALRAEKNSYPLSSVDVFNDHSVKITALVTNQDPVTGQTLVNKGYFINEMGLFARINGGEDDTEVLYSIAVTTGENGDFMPPFNGYYPVHIIQEYYATVDNSAEVTIQADVGAVILTEDYLKLKSDVGSVDIAKGDLQTQLNHLYELLGTTDMEEAFYSIFTKIRDDEAAAMSSAEITGALNTEWDGLSSTDADALSSTEIDAAMAAEWDGQSSTDANALASAEISGVTG